MNLHQRMNAVETSDREKVAEEGLEILSRIQRESLPAFESDAIRDAINKSIPHLDDKRLTFIQLMLNLDDRQIAEALTKLADCTPATRSVSLGFPLILYESVQST